jgi:hypothetical protein
MPPLNLNLFNLGGAGAKAGKLPAPPKPPSIIGQAMIGHPSWFPGSTPKPTNSGIGTAGSAVANSAANLTQPTTPASTPGAASPSATAATGGSPLDSTYYQNVADNTFKVQNAINALNLTGTNDQTALQTALAALAYQQPRDQLALEQKANQSGGLYSSVENMNQANLVHSYATKQTADQTTYQNDLAKIAAQIAADQGGIPVYNANQALLSGARAATLAQNNPGLAAPAVPPAPAAGAAGKATAKPVKPNINVAGKALSNRQQLINELSKKKA